MAEILPSPEAVGFPTGKKDLPYYRYAFWRGDMEACDLSYPIMHGWGGNDVSLFPSVTVIRLASDWDGDERAAAQGSVQAAADAISNVCQ